MNHPMLATSALALGLAVTGPASAATDKAAVLNNYADIAQAKYEDSLIAAKALRDAVERLVSDPSPMALERAREAWIAARVPYQQTEVYRFGNPIVDDWEGKVNAWPLDEGLIDYVDASYGGPSDENELAALNIVANSTFTLSGKEVDASEITPELLADTLHEADGVEANVATGYHAIEFLLWGQDLNGHNAGAGNRPWTDYAAGADCTNDNCDRRADYLRAATDLLVSDLEWMTQQWAEGGAARETVTENPDKGITAILTGMGSLSYGEQAGERMRLGLMLNDPEEEHDCFSDNTHNSHYYDGLGIQNVYLGDYVRIDGTEVSGPSLSDLVADSDPALDAEMRAKLATTMRELGQIKTAAEAGFSYDMMLARDSAAGEALIMGGVDALIDQTRTIERIVSALGSDAIAFEGSDSLDDPDAVFQ
ncbi:peptidase [Roseovarius sp. SCSIO 43702]|uniref:imelysin family protein n=1 Tax=Roseovarius sp. SCSIO 43702 TaxID=2823043 RepID=UPI001C72BBDD|nr:imelysin family protein [Roseovarius sp. SCSIO 43702]QYX57591.1 peptidase [Roseovarius sp. SCSIO 43702]